MPVRISIEEYDPLWPGLFEREALRIRGALGPGALRVEHSGSTSVPDLAAKPVLDIVPEVANSADESSYQPAPAIVRYELTMREPEWYEPRMPETTEPENQS